MPLLRKASTLIALTSSVLLSLLSTPKAAGTSASPLQSLYMIKQLVPNAQTVGVMWNKSAANTSTLLPELNRASAEIGVKVVVEDAEQMKDISDEFRDLVQKYHVQVLWVIENDDPLGNSVSMEYLIKNATLNGVALFAPSTNWVSAGACAALMSEGGKAKLYINKKTLNALGLKVPQQFAQATQFLATN